MSSRSVFESVLVLRSPIAHTIPLGLVFQGKVLAYYLPRRMPRIIHQLHLRR